MKLELKDGSVSAGGRRFFQGLSFVARGGELVCIAGDAGSGKTLLLRALLGMWPLDEGVASVDGAVVTPLSAPWLRRRMGYVPQDRPADLFADVVELMQEMLDGERRVVLLDEPLTGQPDSVRQQVLQAVRELMARGVAVVLTCAADDRLLSHVQGLSDGQMQIKFVELWKYQSCVSA